MLHAGMGLILILLLLLLLLLIIIIIIIKVKEVGKINDVTIVIETLSHVISRRRLCGLLY